MDIDELDEKSELLKDIEEIVKKRKQREEVKTLEAPLSQVDSIMQNRTVPGEGRLLLGGLPVDVFSIEDFIVRVSPADIKTLMRLDGSRIIEMMKNNPREIVENKRSKINWGLIFLIIMIGVGAFVLIWLGLPMLSNLKLF